MQVSVSVGQCKGYSARTPTATSVDAISVSAEIPDHGPDADQGPCSSSSSVLGICTPKRKVSDSSDEQEKSDRQGSSDRNDSTLKFNYEVEFRQIPTEKRCQIAGNWFSDVTWDKVVFLVTRVFKFKLEHHILSTSEFTRKLQRPYKPALPSGWYGTLEGRAGQIPFEVCRAAQEFLKLDIIKEFDLKWPQIFSKTEIETHRQKIRVVVQSLRHANSCRLRQMRENKKLQQLKTQQENPSSNDGVKTILNRLFGIDQQLMAAIDFFTTYNTILKEAEKSGTSSASETRFVHLFATFLKWFNLSCSVPGGQELYKEWKYPFRHDVVAAPRLLVDIPGEIDLPSIAIVESKKDPPKTRHHIKNYSTRAATSSTYQDARVDQSICSSATFEESSNGSVGSSVTSERCEGDLEAAVGRVLGQLFLEMIVHLEETPFTFTKFKDLTDEKTEEKTYQRLGFIQQATKINAVLLTAPEKHFHWLNHGHNKEENVPRSTKRPRLMFHETERGHLYVSQTYDILNHNDRMEFSQLLQTILQHLHDPRITMYSCNKQVTNV